MTSLRCIDSRELNKKEWIFLAWNCGQLYVTICRLQHSTPAHIRWIVSVCDKLIKYECQRTLWTLFCRNRDSRLFSRHVNVPRTMCKKPYFRHYWLKVKMIQKYGFYTYNCPQFQARNIHSFLFHSENLCILSSSRERPRTMCKKPYFRHYIHARVPTGGQKAPN